LSPNQPEITINVTNRETEKKTCDSIVELADYEPIKVIRPLYFIPIDYINFVSQQRA
jgi:hypothetical protein